MFSLRKLHPPFGTKEAPLVEASYAEGEIRVADGLCEVRLPETRDRLLKLGFVDAEPAPQEKPGRGRAARPPGRR